MDPMATPTLRSTQPNLPIDSAQANWTAPAESQLTSGFAEKYGYEDCGAVIFTIICSLN